MALNCKAVLFDFDGTLVDSSEGIFKSLMYAFEADGKPIPDEATLRKFIGPPIYDSFKNLFGYKDEKIDWMIAKYRERYRAIGYREVEVYAGIPALLERLHQNGIKIATASSKPTVFIEKILEERNLLSYFDYLGGTDFDNISSDKTVIMQDAMRALSVSPQETVMVGDRLYDIRGAKGASVPCIAVLYGFGSREEFLEYGADYIVRTPKEIENLIFGV
ncbi:MAG: HAD hydrolase-like protein [Candidatus Fimenecus sp.]